MQEKIFLIGPIREKRAGDVENYNATKTELEKYGYSVTIPYDLNKPEITASEIVLSTTHILSASKLGYRKKDGYWHIRPYYDYVALLKGWDKNTNAILLFQLAEAFGLRCRPWVEYVQKKNKELMDLC